MARSRSSITLLSSFVIATTLGAWACTLNANTDDKAKAADDPLPARAADSGASQPEAPKGGSDAGAGGDAASGIDESLLYEGTWAYQDAAALVLVCPGQPAIVTDLAKAGRDGTNGTFVLSRRAGQIHEVDGLGCEYDFDVVDHAAVTTSVQTCNKFPDGKGGFLPLTTVETHKTTRDGRTLNVAARAKVGPGGACDLYVEGHALKVSSSNLGGGSQPPPPVTLPDAGSAPERDRYVATWTYGPNSALVVACPGQPASVVDLSTADSGKAGAFVFSALGASGIHELDGAGCQYDFAVQDGAAVLARTQTCDGKFRDARGNPTLLTTVTARKTSWDGSSMIISARAKLGASGECDLFVEGTAKATR